MKKDVKNAEIAEILRIYYAFKQENHVKRQKDFAELLGLNPNTLSGALGGREGVSTKNVLRLAREKAAEFGIMIEQGEHSQVITQGDHGEQKILGDSKTAELLVQELAAQREQYGRQIDRLLTIIENISK